MIIIRKIYFHKFKYPFLLRFFMGLFRNMRRGERVNISGKGISIDLVVEQLSGTDNLHREADFMIEGLHQGPQHLHLSYRDGLVPLLEGVYIGVREYCDYPGKGRRVPVHFSMAPEYIFYRYDRAPRRL